MMNETVPINKDKKDNRSAQASILRCKREPETGLTIHPKKNKEQKIMAWRSLKRKTMNTYTINGYTYFAPSLAIAKKMHAERSSKVEDQPVLVNVDPDFDPLAYLLGRKVPK